MYFWTCYHFLFFGHKTWWNHCIFWSTLISMHIPWHSKWIWQFFPTKYITFNSISIWFIKKCLSKPFFNTFIFLVRHLKIWHIFKYIGMEFSKLLLLLSHFNASVVVISVSFCRPCNMSLSLLYCFCFASFNRCGLFQHQYEVSCFL